jgi:Amt family ammonium transporter
MLRFKKLVLSAALLYAGMGAVSAPVLLHADDTTAVPVTTSDVAATAAPAPAAAAAPLKVDSGDTAWVLLSAALVLLMTPGLAFFYGGLVRKKNMLSVLMQCFMLMCLISVEWTLVGYSMAFGPDVKGFIGNLSWACLHGVGLDPNGDYAATIPHQAFMIFQAMFAIITPGLIIGSFAERMKFSTFCVFSLLWALIVYNPIAHWVWGVGGFLRNAGTLDFAGGTVVHINAGVAGLAGALAMGKRKGYPDKTHPPHNLPFALLGASLLWFGWFGFNAGSALGANGLATNAFVTTNMATAAAGLTWALLDKLFAGRATVLGIITGAVAGLVAVTPAAGFVNVMGALAIGVGVSVVCFAMVSFVKPKLGYDDSLDAFGVHGIGGMWGAIATGLFATKAVNSAGADGLFYGNPAQLMIQIKAVLITTVYSFVVSFILFKVLDMIMGLRVDEQSERVGLDLTEHKEAAYTVLE